MNNLVDTSVTFNGKEIRIYGAKHMPYFNAKDCAEILEYTDTCNAIRWNVSRKNKMILRDINHMLKNNNIISSLPKLINIDYKSMWINETGLQDLISGSKGENVKFFKDWIFESVLPQIYKNGKLNLLFNIDAEITIPQTLPLEYDGFVCISTTDILRSNNLFKLQYVKNIKKSMLNFYIYIFRATNAKILVEFLYDVLEKFKYQKYIFCIEYEILVDIIEKYKK
jgi:prophage antirepressor-like protein